ncbi:MAG TPA: orotidine-5'-phosphate decarboxylase [Gemmatimonadales bacterium]
MAEIIVALDVPTAADADRLLGRIPEAGWVKVGSILMTREGPAFVRRLVAAGLDVFLDLKWHDIPNTVAGAVAAARDIGVAMATVHALGGRAMMAAAAEAAGDMTLVGVTVLTSHGAEGFARAVGRDGVTIEDEVARLAGEAFEAGLDGIVCSPQEIERVRSVAPRGAAIVVPGIRRREDAAGDQVRLADPGTARARGATHLVVGRPILSAADPAAVLREMSLR